jgi:hypothetical protein
MVGRDVRGREIYDSARKGRLKDLILDQLGAPGAPGGDANLRHTAYLIDTNPWWRIPGRSGTESQWRRLVRHYEHPDVSYRRGFSELNYEPYFYASDEFRIWYTRGYLGIVRRWPRPADSWRVMDWLVAWLNERGEGERDARRDGAPWPAERLERDPGRPPLESQTGVSKKGT